MLAAPMAERLGTEKDKTCVAVPGAAPAVTATRSDPPMPAPPRHTSAELEAHSVASTAVGPILPATEYCAVPKLPPRRVSEAPPVDGAFGRARRVRKGTSKESASVVVPARAPTVSRRRIDAATPAGARHAIAVADTQEEASHAEPPTRAVLEFGVQGSGFRV